MKKLAAEALIVVAILALFSCASQRAVQLVNLTTNELPSETELVLTTTHPVPYKDTKLEKPPCLIINFPENKVFSKVEDELKINKGPIINIKNEYYPSANKDQHQLNLLIVELAQDLPYKIAQSGSSIIIKIENPKQSPPPQKEKKVEAQIEAKETPLVLEPAYLIGPEDVLTIEVWKHPDVSGEVTVDYKGDIKLPPVRKLNVAGMATFQLEEELTKALSKYLIDPIVFVKVKEYNSQRVIALGEITTGMYSLKRKTTLTEFLGQIGGMKSNSDSSHIKLIKKDGKISSYDFNELINNPKKSEEVVVSGGDTVYIPPLEMNKVFVLGEVKNPQVVNIKGTLSITEAITQAGGFTQNAVKSSVLVIRGELGSQKGFRLNLNQLLKHGDLSQNINLKPGDIIYVPKSFVADIERFLSAIALPVTWYIWTKPKL
jgi:polysaccharide export outer membrane protein